MKKIDLISIIIASIILISLPNSNYCQNINSPNHNGFLKMSQSLNTNSPGFVENKGQWNEDVKFLARLKALNFWVTKSKIVFDFYQIESEQNKKTENPGNLVSKIENVNFLNRKGCVIEMSFSTDPAKTFSVKGNAKQEGYLNYLLGSSSAEPVTYVSKFSEIYLSKVSEGIDMKIYFDQGYLRYDLIVSAGADLSQFKIILNGQDGLSVSNENELEFMTSLGQIFHKDLNAYQENSGLKNKVNCRFAQASVNEIKFVAGQYDKSKELIIDPLIYSSFIGGNQYDEIWSLVSDTSGYLYAVGSTASYNFPTSSGAYHTSNAGGAYDGYVTKFNLACTGIIYSTYLGGDGQDLGIGAAVMPNGDLIISGRTFSTNFPVTSGAYQTYRSGTNDGYISKLNSTGTSLVYSTLIGGSSGEYTYFTRLDASGNLYMFGYTGSSNFPTTSGAYQTYAGGGDDCFAAKLNPGGTSLIWSTYIGGSGAETPADLEIDNNLNTYLAGWTSSSNFRTSSGAYQTSHGGGSNDGFVVKLNSSGTTALFSTYFGKSGSELLYDVEVDLANRVIISGSTTSTNFTASSGAIQSTFGGGTIDVFVAKLSSTGNSLLNFTYLGGNGADDIRGLILDNYGNIYVGGFTSSNNYPVTNCAYQTSYAGGSYDVSISKMTSDMTALIYSTYFGGNNTDQMLENMFFDTAGYLIFNGRTVSSNFPTTSGAYNTSFNGGSNDGFLAKIDLSNSSSSITTGTLSTISFCGGGTISVPFTSTCNFNYGNIFTVQMSDNSGSFSNPINIGTTQAWQPVAISAKIPDTMSSGNGYKIRVIASDPYTIGSATSQNVTIGPKPFADFSINDTAQCLVNNSFVFTNNSYISSGYVAVNVWNFGDGGNYSVLSPTHSYANANTYNVTLITISDINCKDTIVKKVYVDGFKKVAFEVNDSTQCQKNNQYIFTNKTAGVGNVNYFWTFGNGKSSSSINATQSYSYDSTFPVKLKATSEYGCSDSASKTVYVYADPYVNFLINNPDQCYRNHNFLFTNHSSITNGTLKYLWDFGNGDTSTALNVQHTYNAIHSYVVKLWVASDMGCKDSISKTVFLRHSPTASFTVSDTIMCYNSNRFVFTNFSTIASGTLDYLWKFQDTTYCYSKDTVHVFGWADTFDVVMHAISDWGCVDSMTKRIIVKVAPDAEFTSKPGFDQCFKGNVFNFQNQTKANGPVNYKWDLGDGTKSTNTNIAHTYAAPGSFQVKLLAYNNSDCRDSITKIANVNPVPNVGFDINDTSQCINGNSFIFTNKSSISGGTLYYFWSFGDGGFSMSKNSTHSYTYGDTFEIKLTALSNVGCNDSMIKYIVVSTGPRINLGNDTILADTQSITLNAGSGNDKYLWSTGATSSQITVDTTGIGLHSKMIWVIATKDSCSSKDSIKITFIHKNDIAENNRKIKLMVYPNPTTGEVYLKQSGKEITDIRIIDLLGNVRLEQPFNSSLNIKELPPAVYFINALNQKGAVMYQVKIVKF
jgi:PKD repeat protein